MSKNQKLKRIEEKDLPILYRLLIKIPLKSLGLSNGIFWGARLSDTCSSELLDEYLTLIGRNEESEKSA